MPEFTLTLFGAPVLATSEGRQVTPALGTKAMALLEAAFDTLSPSRRQEFGAIRELLAYFLPALERADSVLQSARLVSLL